MNPLEEYQSQAAISTWSASRREYTTRFWRFFCAKMGQKWTETFSVVQDFLMGKGRQSDGRGTGQKGAILFVAVWKQQKNFGCIRD